MFQKMYSAAVGLLIMLLSLENNKVASFQLIRITRAPFISHDVDYMRDEKLGSRISMAHRKRSVALKATSARSAASRRAASVAQTAVTETAIAHKIGPFFSKLFLRESSLAAVFSAVRSTLSLPELCVLAVFALATVPAAKNLYQMVNSSKIRSKPWTDSYSYHAAVHLSQVAKIGVFIYAADCLAVALNAMNVGFLLRSGFSRKVGTISIILWVTMRVRYFKTILVNRVCKTKDGNDINASVYNRAGDALIYLTSALALVDLLKLKVGATLKSIFAVGGFGTLVLSLASKDLATQLVSGMAIGASGSFSVGDKITLGDGTQGFVTKMGPLYTEIQDKDEITTRIPNSQIASQRLSNISRANHCRVKQTLWFKYDDVDNLPRVLKTIRKEIKKSCPQLISDGTRPFIVNLSSYESDHVEVSVDCRFRIPPRGMPFVETRETVLEAIARAAKEEEVEFAFPSYVSRNLDVSASKAAKEGAAPPVNSEQLSQEQWDQTNQSQWDAINQEPPPGSPPQY